MTTEAALTGISIFLALAILAITIWLEHVKDNKLEDWLERTLFGTLDGHTYDPKQELAEYDLALAEIRG